MRFEALGMTAAMNSFGEEYTWKDKLQRGKSGAGEQFLLKGCRAKARVKFQRVVFSEETGVTAGGESRCARKMN